MSESEHGQTGKCHCGAVTYTIAGEAVPEHHCLCHCTDCRRHSGAPAVGWVRPVAGSNSSAVDARPAALRPPSTSTRPGQARTRGCRGSGATQEGAIGNWSDA